MAVKKTAKKKSIRKTDVEMQKIDLENESMNIEETKKSFFQKPVNIILLIAIFFILGSLIYKNKQFIIVGSVNNKPITSFELYKKMVSQSGKQTLEQIIVEKLILNEAGKKNITISDKDIDDEISKIENNLGDNTKLSDALVQQGMTLSDLRSQVKMRLIAVKLVEDKVAVSDEEVTKYMTDNKDYLPKDQDAQKQKETVTSTLRDQKINDEIQKIITDLKSSAKISTFL